MLHIPPMMLVFIVLFAVIAGAMALLSWAMKPKPETIDVHRQMLDGYEDAPLDGYWPGAFEDRSDR